MFAMLPSFLSWTPTLVLFSVLAGLFRGLEGQNGGEQPLNLQETGTKGQNVNDMTPENIFIQMKLGKDNLKLNLVKNTNIGKFAPVILSSRRNMLPWSNQKSEDFGVYQDKENRASILAFSGRNEDGKILREYQGTFWLKNENYMFESRSGPGRRKKRGTDPGGYVVYKAPKVENEFGPQRQSNVSFTYYGQMLEYINMDQNKRNYVVETLVVVDFAVFNRWYTLSEKKTTAEKTDDAINGIRYYYSQIVNGMDLRFSSIVHSSFTLNVKLAGFFIAMTAADSPWTEGADRRRVVDNYVFTDAYKALDNFDSWTSQHQNDLPSFDQASLFTGNRLMAGYTPDNYPFSISGLANIKAVCSKGRVSINREAGEYASTQTASHELGHNLGAYHDGDGNTCSKSDQYIMAAVPALVNDNNYNNPFHFSACSVEAMKTYLSMLTLMNTNCLLRTARVDETDVEKNAKLPVGQFLNVDKQCQHLYGVGSYYCGGALFDEQICGLLYCFNPRSDVNRCTTKSEQRAANGTSCGNKKWCNFGKCVYSTDAPATPEKCISGDRRGIVGDGMTCADKIKSNTALCYQDYWSQTCCTSCQKIRDENTDDCPYGDRDIKYCANLKESHCYEKHIQDTCCVSCKKFQTHVSTCLYGDKASWCGANDDPSICYSSSESCCSYCMLMRTGYSDCMYGDRAAWCKTISPKLCADRNNTQICCQTCDSTKTTQAPGYHVTVAPSELVAIDPGCTDSASWCANIKPNYCYTTKQICCRKCYYLDNGDRGCEYGDRFDWCKDLSLDSCKYIEYQEDCCSRCAATRRRLRDIKSSSAALNALWLMIVAASVTASFLSTKH